MKILDRYIGRSVVAATLTVLLVLLAIFSFFTFIEELEDLGRGTYGLPQVANVALLRLPGLAYELFPIAALIGALIGLGALVERSEISVVRAAGVSKMRLVGAVMKAGAVCAVGALLIGECVFPPAERRAQELRAFAISERAGARSQPGFWARDGSSYVNIREILPGQRFGDVRILEFDDTRRLRAATAAASARYLDGRWELREIAQTLFAEDGSISARRLSRAAWDSLLDPDLIAMVTVNPKTLSLLELARYVQFVKANGQNAQPWAHALWIKIAYPAATAVMVFLAIPLVFAGARSVSGGRRILLGALLGLAFHVLNQASGHLGVVFGLPAVASALGPTLSVLAVAMLLAYRTR